MADEYKPESCPKCEGDMDAAGEREWKCGTCGLLITEGPVPSWPEMAELIGNINQPGPREYIGLDGPINEKGGGSKSGKKAKKRPSSRNPFANNYLDC